MWRIPGNILNKITGSQHEVVLPVGKWATVKIPHLKKLKLDEIL
jgi:hypothetical protein